MKGVLYEVATEYRYASKDGSVTMKRENGMSPNGNSLNGWWVLRVNGEFVDFDQYRADLVERNDMIISYPEN